MKSVELKGMAWDHPRGYGPLRATSAEFEKRYPGIHITWDIRSLKEFGDMPIENLIESYDLITIDHPYMGQAHQDKLLLPLESYVSESDLKALEKQSVGPSFASYRYQGHQYALPIDAAALVSVSRNDLISELGLTLPETRTGLLDFYKKVPEGHTVAWPLCPTDLWCSFLTLCAQDAGRDFIQDHRIEEKTGVAVLEELKHHLEHLHPESLLWNPIQVLDRMGGGEDIVYSPFLFGYTNYSRDGYAKYRVSFSNGPTNPKTDVSTILGGVGLAISSNCQYIDVAAAYVNDVARERTQEGLYTESGGQPANLVAWESASNNVLCHNFFDGTRTTMEKAYVRPQHVGWNRFQEQGAELLHQGLVRDIPSTKVMKDLNQLYQSIKNYE